VFHPDYSFYGSGIGGTTILPFSKAGNIDTIRDGHQFVTIGDRILERLSGCMIAHILLNSSYLLVLAPENKLSCGFSEECTQACDQGGNFTSHF
jgi:hypothetical protein